MWRTDNTKNFHEKKIENQNVSLHQYDFFKKPNIHIGEKRSPSIFVIGK